MIEDIEAWQGTDELSAEQREFFERLLAEDDIELEERQPIPRRGDTGEVPLSFGQQRLWILQQLDPASSAYNMPSALRMDGRLDRQALAASLADTVRRHESLRTTFHCVDERPVQVVAPEAHVELPLADLSGIAPEDRPAQLEALFQAEARRPFNLETEPPLRTLLIELGREEHILLFTLHHIASDGWSTGVLIRELGALYEAHRAGRPPALPELPIQYADYAVWQRQWLSGEVLEGQFAYWREQLAGVPPVLDLPTDRPRPATRRERGGVEPLHLPADLLRDLKAIAWDHDATLFMVLLAGFAALLQRYTGKDDLAVGTPIAGRNRAETEGLIGFFVNTLVMRADLSGDPSFLDVVRRVRETALEAYAHQDLPFERLIDELEPVRDLSRTPLFQVMFVLQNTPAGALELEGLRLEALEVKDGTAKFDLLLTLGEEEGALAGSIEYDSDLFDRTTVSRMAAHLHRLLAGAAAMPARALSLLPLQTEAERHQLLAEYNDTAAAFGADVRLHDWIERQAALSPDAVAVVFEDSALSYGELDARANRLGRHLRRLGVGAEGVAGICADRSVELMVGLLGILKAGAAYLPLDPSYPAERLAFMVEDGLTAAGRPVLLLQGRFAPLFAGWSAGTGARRIDLDRLDEELAGESGEPLEGETGPGGAAYVIYTSGSTGRPKGVVNTHGGICNRLLWMQAAYGLGARDVVLQKTPVSFDVSVWELFWPLMTGARLVLARPGGHRDSAYLVGLIEEREVTTLHFVPSMLQAFLEEPDLGRCVSVRQVMASGEALPSELARRCLASLGAELHNLYGPTEAAVDVTYHACRAAGVGEAPGVPIGRPISNLGIWLFDRGLQPVPLGVPGELHIGGVGLARGYLNRPALTAERFVPHPASVLPGERLYRTGDLARFLPGGEIEFLGRTDHQVKVRGFRIELGEIEAALLGHPGVQAATVLALDGASGQKRLAAFWVPAGEGATVDGLRSILRDRLPEHMVPSSFVRLAAMPRTPNGKTDRRALLERAREAEAERPAGRLVLPRAPAEEQLAAIFAAVLRRTDIGVHDNFFELGGDSILALQVVSRAHQAGLRLTPRQLFERQTVAGLAEVAVPARKTGAVRNEEEAGPVALSPIQHFFFAQDLPRPGHFNQALLLQAGGLQPAALARAVERVVAHHGALRARFEPPTADRPVWRQVLVDAGEVAQTPLAWVDLSALPADRRSRALEAAAAERQAGFDLATPPLFAAVLFTLGEGLPDRLLLAAHHLVVDGVSWRILLEDLESAYAGAELPARTAGLRNWTEALAAYARSAAAEAHADFWLRRLAAPAPRLPFDHPADADTVAAAASVTVSLDTAETRELIQEVPRAYRARIQEVLLAALAEALAPAAGGGRLLVDLEGHGRDGMEELQSAADLDLSRTVGWFTSLYPVAFDLEGAAAPGAPAAPGATLAAVREQLREVPANGAVYGPLRYLGREEVRERLAGLQRPEVVFNYLGQIDQVVAEDRLFGGAPESAGPLRDGRQPRLHPLEINASVAEGRLQVEWTYGSARHRRATVEGWAGRFLAALRTLIAERGRTAAAALTAAGLPLDSRDSIETAELVPVARGAESPLSFGQQLIWLHQQLSPGSSAQNLKGAVWLHGRLDVAAFAAGLTEVVRRHEVLRTTFPAVGGGPVARVSPAAPVPLPVADLSGLPAETREREMQRALEAQVGQPFDLTRGPLLSALLVRLDVQEQVLSVSVHHIASDAWSLGILVRELAVLYEAFQAGRPSPLPELPLQYADFAVWQRRLLAGEELERRLDFWRRRLTAGLPDLELPADMPRLRSSSYRGRRESFRLSPATAQGLRGLARRQGATLFMALLGAFETLLLRISGQERVRVGSPIAGRERPEVEGLIGVFLETVVFEADLAGRPSFLELLARVRDDAFAAYARQVPFGELLADLQPDQEAGRTPLFQALFNMVNLRGQEIRLPGLTFESLPPSEMAAKFDWTLYAMDDQEDVELMLVYDADLFGEARMREVRGQLESLLEQAVAYPDAPVAGLSLVTEAARRLLPDPRQEIAEPAFDPVAVTFLAWARREPGRPALSGGGADWTYAELADRAVALARRLVARGVAPGEVVAVSGARCPDLVVSFLAVMLARGVLMPLDRKLPEPRQRLMLDTARASWLLAVGPRREDEAWMERLPGVEVVAYPASAADEWAEGPLPTPDADDPAYVFFTSGTSGQPKGVLGLQKGLSHFVAWEREAFGIGPDDRVAQLIGLSFDAMLRDVFLPLTSGATLCLPPGDDLTAEHILPWLGSAGVTAFHSVPSLAAVWLGAVPEGLRLPALRWVFLSGEPLYGQLVERFHANFPSARVVNFYGSTETTLIRFSYVVPDPPAPGIQPAGTPLPQTQGLVRNAEGGLCGVGEPGEIVVRTPFRTLGYLAGEEGDAAPCFRPNPFTGDPRDLVYFSGDRGRYRPDGLLEVLGRVDDQVKIRGVRVEPAEVNAVLGRQPEVRESFVMAREEGPGDKRLVAYLVLHPGEVLDVGGLRQRLRRQLPDPMVPTAYVALDALPLSATGKVDRRALPAPDEVLPEPAPGAPEAAADEGAPRNAVEEILAALCCELLEAERIDVRADFFDIGMHSLLALQLFSRVQETFGVELPLHEVFDSPTVAGLAQRVEEALRSEVRATPLAPVPRDEPLPLSFGQQRLWFLHQMEPGSAVYNLARVVLIEGRLDTGLLEASLGAVVARHESLRTTFQETPEGPVQVIAPATGLRLPVVDLSGLAPARGRGMAEGLAGAELRRPFDLAAGPLLRPLLVRLGARGHLLVVAIHHIVTDGQSIRLMIDELAAFYAAGRDGRRAALAPLPIQYADFAAWQRRWLSSELLASELGWWREKLGSSPTVLELPTDRPRPAVRTFAGARRPVALPPSLLADLRTLSRRQGTTLFMTLLAGFASVLGRWSGQDDLLVGTPGGGRNRTEVEGLVGFFVNMLVLRVDLAGDPGFSSLLERTRGFALEAYRHADLPFEKLVDELLPRRDLAHTPLFQVAFMFDAAAPPVTLPGLRLSALEAETGTSQFDLRLALGEAAEGIGGFLEYNTDLFAAATVDRLIGHLATLLAGAVAAPERRLSDLPLLNAAERAMVVEEWNDTRRELARAPLVHQLFEERARLAPHAVAVISRGVETTYAELDARAGRLAHLLRFCGVGPGDMAGVLLDRSAEMVVAVLGILKSGAAYVPLETRSPVDRMAWILETMNVRVLVTGASRLAALPALAPAVPTLAHAVCLDGPEGAAPELPPDLRLWAAADLASFPAETPEPLSGPDDPAYVIFTSGSTGRPKGVLVRHRPVINLIDWVNRTFEVGPADRLLFIASLGFDLSVYDMFGVLAAGGSIRVAVAEELEDPRLLARALATEPITFWDTAPAALQQLVPWLPEVVAAGAGRSLRLVFLSGDWVPLALPDQVRASFPGARVIALGGATEATVWSNVFPVGEVDPRWRSIPYGRPIQNARYYVLDPTHHPCPIGVPGDLFIGGDCLATGYAAAPALTAAQYMPDPFAGVPGAVMYRTGDRARFFADGNIEFLGRLDQQVKVRGFRVELGEIESVLKEHPAVAATVAAVREDRAGERRIAAYLVCREGARPDIAELRALVKERLPEYMMPAAFVFLDALPLSANGKVDRKGLPRPEWSADEEYVAPRGGVEETLARIWGEVLRRERVGVDDNFFELGGDSILSIQVVSRASQEGLAVTPRQLFENPTVAGLARVARAVAATAAPEAAAPAAYRGPVPLTPVERWFFAQDLVHPEHFNQAVMLELPLEGGAERGGAGRFDAARLARAWQAVLDHHPAFGLRFLPPATPGGAWTQVAGEPPAGTCGEVDLSALPAARRSEALIAAAEACQAGHDLAAGRLCRAALFHLGGGEPARLAVVLHHLLVDGVSWRILLEDLETAWRQLTAGQPVALAPATAPFRLWAERLAAYAEDPAVLAEERFWTGRLGRAGGRLPAEVGEGGNTVRSAREVSVELSAAETRALLQEVPRAYRTRINDVLLTALAEAFAAWTGERRLLVDLEAHGREEVFPDLDLSRTFGWFTAIYPVGLDLEGTPGGAPGQALKAVKEQLRSIPGHGIGYGLLRYLTAGEAGETVRALPRPEVVFNYHGQLDQAAGASRLFRGAVESPGAVRHPGQARLHLLEVSARIYDGRLHVVWTYSEDRHRRDTVETLAEGFLASLRALVAHCLSPEAGGATPSDFPLARLDQAALDRLGAGGRIEDLFPASPVQEGMVFHSLHSPGSGVYVEQLNLELGGLDVPAFERAFARLLERHAILRTAFVRTEDDRLLAVVRPVEPIRDWCDKRDWRGLGEAGQRRALAGFLEADRRRGFDLETAPLTRLALLRTREDWCRCVWTFHHVLLDGWSVPMLLQEIFALYAAEAGGEEPRLPARRPFRDYVAWLEAQPLAAAEAFWRRALRGFTAPTPLVVDRSLPEAADPEAPQDHGKAGINLGAAEDLREFARRHRLTVNTLVQGAWAVLLHRYSSESDVAFGVVTSGRSIPLPGIDAMVGMFINTLPLRVRVSPAASLVDWLQEIQESQAEMRQFEHSPLAEVQAWSDVPRGTPLFHSILAFENYPVAETVETVRSEAADEVRFGEAEFTEQTNYPLNVVVTPRGELVMKILYERNRFDEVSVRRMLGHLQSLLAGVLAAPAASLDTLPLMTAEERQQMLWEWSDTGKPCPQRPLVHQLFSEHARRRPQAPAVGWGDGEVLTYGELEARSNRLAHHLRALGIGPEVLVALCMERTPERVVGIVGTLKAGGAYASFDPTYPRERLAFLLDDARAPIVLTQELFRPLLPETEARVICLDTDWEWIEGNEEAAPAVDVDPDNLAYVVYTSGSTGKPKGVEIPHAGLMNLVRWHQDLYRVTPDDRGTQIASPAFDASIWELWPYLAGGASVHIPDEETRLSPAGMIRWWSAQRITLAYLMTPLAEGVLEEKVPPGLDLGVRALIIGGDRLHRGPDPEVGFALMNHYGPAEYTVTSTVVRVPPEGEGSAIPTIGRPVDNTRVYLLDQHFEPAPVGVPGELFVGGIGIARGYLHRPDLTAARFVPDPLASERGEPGARVYQTGDLVRWTADGDMDFLGRLDHQVKVRGLRIELGEIEAALGDHPAVREGVVLVREDRPGDRRLVAYFVAHAAPPPAGELRAFLGERLPEYMIPVAFLALEALPMTPNGKVDRRALPAPEWAATAAYVAPRGPVEETLAAIWSEVLKVERVGVDDSFFELGGDSILSIQVISRAARAGLRITPRQLFEHPTIARLAPLVEAFEAADAAADAASVAGPVALTPIQGRFFGLRPAHPEHFNLGLLLAVTPVEGPEERTAALLERALGHLLRHHDALRMRYEQADGEWRQVAEETVATPWIGIDLGALPADRREEAMAGAAEAVQASLDLAVAPPLRAAFFRSGDGAGRLLWTIHHLVVDAVSWRILLEDLEAAYVQLARGEEVVLPPRTASFQRWAARLADLATEPRTTAAGERWLSRLHGTSPLPVDSEEGDVHAGAACRVVVGLDADETRALLKEAPRAYRTQVNDLLLSALAAALGRFTGGRRVLFELEGHGRDEELAGGLDLSRTVGWFTSMHPVVIDCGAHLAEGGGALFAAPGEALKSVKEQLRALAADAASYGLLRYLGEPGTREALAALPPAEVLFNYLGQLDGVAGGAGAAGEALVRPVDGPVGPLRHPGQARAHLLEINGAVQNGRLEMVWSYSENRHRRETVERLAADFAAALRELVAHCLSPQAGGATPSDFPLARLGQAALDRVLAATAAAAPGAVLEDLYPATPAQQGMLFHTLQAPGSGVYVEQVKLTLAGIDVAAFERAWRRVVDRHAILRTAWLWHHLDAPLQAVHRRVDVPFRCEDWRGMSAEEQETLLAAWLADDRREGFDVHRPPLLRLTLMRLDERSYRFVWTFHHMLLDGWSMSPLMRDLFTFYALESTGTGPALEPVRPFRDYIAWLERQDLAAAEQAWRRTLAGFTAPTPLALPRPAAPVDSLDEEPGRYLAHLSPETTEGLKAFARRHQLTLNTVMQGCWALLLGRYAGEDDVVFGIVTAGRSAPLSGIHGMVGLFLNTLPVRVALPAGERLAPWLQKLQEEQVEARQYDYTPLVQVQAWSDVTPGQPLFESLFAFENYPIDDSMREQAGPGLEIGAVEMLEKTNFPLHLILFGQDRLWMRVFYDRRRFAAEGITRLCRHLEAVCESLLASDDPRLEDLSLLGAEERALLPDPTAALAEPPFPPVSRLFLERAAAAPGASALCQGDAVVSYGELARRAAAIARHLAGRGVAPGGVVAVAGSASLDLIATLLGVLLARGAFLILDRKLPAARRGLMLERSGARHLVRLGDAGEDLEEGVLSGVNVLPLDPEAAVAADTAAGAELADPGPDDPAYVFFTSGTTGTPKAILGRQRGLSHFLCWQRDEFGIGAGDRVGQLTGLAFDVVLRDIFMPLVSGATLCLPPDEDRSPERVLPWLAGEEVTSLHTVPSLASVWLDAVPQGLRLTALRRVFFAGEPLTDHLVRRWRSGLAPRAEVVNLYGPTETTLAKCFFRVPDPPVPGVQPVGTAIPSAQALVVAGGAGGAGGRRCAVGEAGEIVVRTPFRSLGYLAAAEVDRRRFRPNPFTGDEGDLLYFTGDRGRYRADGVLEILGRLDDQVKIRGMRVEPGEVRAVLLRQEGVRECAVVAREDGPGDLRLVAYVVPADAAGFDASEARRLLRGELPDYMVPAAVVTLSALPLTPNGKLDRRALPAPEGVRADHLGRYVAPRNRTEVELVAIWEDLLKVSPVGVRDDFFELGGHSLLAMRLVSVVQEHFGCNLPLATLLSPGTIEDFVALLEREGGARFSSPVVPLRATGSRPRFFCVHPGGGGVFCYRDLAQHLGPEQPFFAFQARGLDGEPVPEETRMEELARTYVEAMRSVQPQGPYLLGGWSFGGKVAFEMARQLEAAGERCAALVLFDAPAPGALELKEEVDLVALAGEVGLAVDEAELRQVAPEARVDYIAGLAAAAGAKEADTGHLRRLFAVQKAHHQASSSYAPDGVFAGKVVVLRARERLNDRYPGLTAGALDFGWSRCCSQPPTVLPVPGDHLTMVRPPHVETLATVLAHVLADVAAPAAGAPVEPPAPRTGAPATPADLSEVPAAVRATHADLSPVSLRFLEYALARPEMARPVDYDRVQPPLPAWLRDYDAVLQPWPVFVDSIKVRQIERATVGLVELVKSIPGRFFGNDPRRIREYYGLEDETLAASMLSQPNGIGTCFARCDLIDDGEHFKCLELNISGSIGGWQIRFFDRLCRSQPGVAEFLAAEGLRARYPDPWRSALAMVLKSGCEQGHDDAGRFNIAVAVTAGTRGWEGVIGAMNELYQEVLRDSGAGCQGEVVKCVYPNDLVAWGDRLFFGDRRISAVIEPTSLPTPRDVYRCFKAGRVGLFNGPITQVLTSKRNLALLSEHGESDLLTAEEREVVRNNVPWSRLVADGQTTYKGERVDLLDFAVARRESLVLKPVAGFKGMGVHMGAGTPPAEWLRHLQGTAGSGKVLLQELVSSRPYLCQFGEAGWTPHQAIWGTFSFAGSYGGSYLRVMPQDRGACVINTLQDGATQGFVYEV